VLLVITGINEAKCGLIYLLIERFEGKLKSFFKLRPKGRPKKKFNK